MKWHFTCDYLSSTSFFKILDVSTYQEGGINMNVSTHYLTQLFQVYSWDHHHQEVHTYQFLLPLLGVFCTPLFFLGTISTKLIYVVVVMVPTHHNPNLQWLFRILQNTCSCGSRSRLFHDIWCTFELHSTWLLLQVNMAKTFNLRSQSVMF